jgi:hypothetical protein
MTSDPSAASPAPPNVHEAERASGPLGAVVRGAKIDFASAVARRQTGEDVVVCGENIDQNRSLAQAIEAAVGPSLRAPPHKRTAGPLALPHFQQQTPPPEGHTFYETDKRKARNRP